MKTGILQEQIIAIIGLGLMGGSLALALQGKVKFIIGIDDDVNTLSSALERGMIDQAGQKPTAALSAVNILILAVPVKTILKLIPDLPNFISPRTLIMDLGSTKRAVMKSFNALPNGYQAVGGHPMCGKASGGLANADGDLFADAPFALVDSENPSAASQKLAEGLVRAAGAHPIWIAAELHDAITASVSHLPYLLSTALVNTTGQASARIIGPGFRSTARLASTPGSMMNDILETNHDLILPQLDTFIASITQLRDLIAKGRFEALFELLDLTAKKHQNLLMANERLESLEN